MVTILDDGIEKDHPDLISNYVSQKYKDVPSSPQICKRHLKLPKNYNNVKREFEEQVTMTWCVLIFFMPLLGRWGQLWCKWWRYRPPTKIHTAQWEQVIWQKPQSGNTMTRDCFKMSCQTSLKFGKEAQTGFISLRNERSAFINWEKIWSRIFFFFQTTLVVFDSALASYKCENVRKHRGYTAFCPVLLAEAFKFRNQLYKVWKHWCSQSAKSWNIVPFFFLASVNKASCCSYILSSSQYIPTDTWALICY